MRARPHDRRHFLCAWHTCLNGSHMRLTNYRGFRGTQGRCGVRVWGMPCPDQCYARTSADTDRFCQDAAPSRAMVALAGLYERQHTAMLRQYHTLQQKMKRASQRRRSPGANKAGRPTGEDKERAGPAKAGPEADGAVRKPAQAESSGTASATAEDGAIDGAKSSDEAAGSEAVEGGEAGEAGEQEENEEAAAASEALEAFQRQLLSEHPTIRAAIDAVRAWRWRGHPTPTPHIPLPVLAASRDAPRRRPVALPRGRVFRPCRPVPLRADSTRPRGRCGCTRPVPAAAQSAARGQRCKPGCEPRRAGPRSPWR